MSSSRPRRSLRERGFVTRTNSTIDIYLVGRPSDSKDAVPPADTCQQHKTTHRSSRQTPSTETTSQPPLDHLSTTSRPPLGHLSTAIVGCVSTPKRRSVRPGPALRFWRPCANLFMGPPLRKFGHRGYLQWGHIIMWMSVFISTSTSEELHRRLHFT